VLSPLRAGSTAETTGDSWLRQVLQPHDGSAARPGQLRYSTIHAFKGLDAPAIVVTDLDRQLTPNFESLLYIGLTRATDRLFAVIEAGTFRSALGERMTGLEARGTVESAVRRELFGPAIGEAPRGKPLDCSSGAVHFETKEDSWGLFHDVASGQEILTKSDPLRRYGIGVLFNGAALRGTTAGSGSAEGDDTDVSWVAGLGENEKARRPGGRDQGKASP